MISDECKLTEGREELNVFIFKKTFFKKLKFKQQKGF